METLEEKYNLYLETLIGVFTIDKGKVKILLVHKKEEPYKGYWVLPGSLVSNKETLDENIENVLYNTLGLPNLYIEQCYTFGDLNRTLDNRIIATSYIGLINNITLILKKQDRPDIEYEWFDINSLPKTGFDHDKIALKLLDYFTNKIKNSNILRILFPSDFTLPELQRIYEQLLNIKLDRRNFRKKLINLGYIIDTGDVNEGNTGRPAKLYRFNEELEERNLF